MSGRSRGGKTILNRLLDVLIFTEFVATIGYGLLIVYFGPGHVPTHFDVTYLIALLVSSSLCAILGPFTRCSADGVRRWKTGLLAVLLAVVGSFLLVIGVGKLT